MAYNSYDLANTSLVKTGGLTEMYIPLWWYSSGSVGTTSATYVYIQKGSLSISASNTGSRTRLHTLSSNWSPTQKFAFEASFLTNLSSDTAYASLWDVTANAQVASSVVSTTSTTATVVRSSQFTLIPGHDYAIGITMNSSGYSLNLNKASLVAFIGG